MGFWSTLLIALRFKTGALQVVTDPLHSHRIRLDLKATHLFTAESVSAYRFVNDVESTSRVRVEAR